MYIFLDCETTGLIPDTHEIIEIALIITDRHLNITGEHVYKIQPQNIEGADRDALAINGYTESKWRLAWQPLEVAHIVRELLDLHKRYIIVAHNPAFDLAFLQHFFKRVLVDHQIPNPIIDTRAVALQTFAPFGLERTSMDRICYYLQWPKPIHQAAQDAKLCIRIMRASYRGYINNAIRLLISRGCDMIGIDYSLM